MTKYFKKIKNNKGFTLIELMVASSIFIIVMLISSGAILSVFSANQKSKTLRSVMDNLNLSMESMTRNIRFGTVYHCDSAIGTPTEPRDCGGAGATSLQFLGSDGLNVIYSLVVDNSFNPPVSRIRRSKEIPLVGTFENNYLTSPDIDITSLRFWVYGSDFYTNGDHLQPRVIIVVKGDVGTNVKTKSTFILETTVSQRQFDFQ